jgi:hypothetical protein
MVSFPSSCSRKTGLLEQSLSKVSNGGTAHDAEAGDRRGADTVRDRGVSCWWQLPVDSVSCPFVFRIGLVLLAHRKAIHGQVSFLAMRS